MLCFLILLGLGIKSCREKRPGLRSTAASLCSGNYRTTADQYKFVQRKMADLEGELLAGPEMIDPVCDDMVYADPDVTEGQQVLLPQLCSLLQQVVVVLQV